MTYQEISHVLAALRWVQDAVPHDDFVTLPHFVDVAPLDDTQINALCEKLNTERPGDD
jgi:hypothetical protein